jgi:predicted ATPase
VTNIPGRGYRFVAPVDLSESGDRPVPKSTAAERIHTLPISQVRALGRGTAIGALLDQLSKHRLITIVGAGGIGKTTVALAVAETLLQTYEDGVWFVDLATLSDACQVPGAIASALGLAVEREYAVSRLTDLLRHKTMLLVLDSCEHVVDAAATMAEQLLSGAPGVRILATSREPLRADGERVHRLSPLEIPPDPAGLSACAAIAYSSVQLFVERAAACVDGFQLSDADASIVIDICHKLGGMPLAIELAAARVDAFGLGQLAVLLDDRFRILNQGRRTAQPRHRSLDAALDWSYEFLPEAERALLRRLSVFTNAFTLMDAVAALAGGDSTDMMDGIANLVAKSLISADAGGAVVQYRLLDTTRAYAQRKLIESDELQRLSTANLSVTRGRSDGMHEDFVGRVC